MAALLGGGSAFRRAVRRDGVRFRVALVIVVVAAVTAATAGILVATRSSGPPARARHYLAFTACMLTDARGLSGDQAGEVWVGLEQASLATHAQVEYLPVTTGSTEAAAAPFLASLVARQCKVVIAVVAQRGLTPKGMSTYDSQANLDSGFPSSQPAWHIHQDVLDNLSEGLGYARDGGLDGLPEGHITIYPTVDMSFSRFTKLIKGLPWIPAEP